MLRSKASNRRKTLWVLLAAISVSTFAASDFVAADGPSILAMFRKKQPAGNAQSLALSETDGPWLILAATLSGEDAQTKAVALANEIYRSLRQPCFIMQKTFDNSQPLGSTTQLVNERDGSKTQYRAWLEYANGSRDEVYAVLVGEFSSTKDPKIPDVLESIRTAQPEALAPQGNPNAATSEDSSDGLVQKARSFIWSRTERGEKKPRGPMGAAFVTRNPLLPADYFQAPKVDDFVLKLNKQVKHSLLECPSRFTVRVASFYGYSSMEMIKGARLGKEKDLSDSLEHAAIQANKLSVALRKKGVEAYQFHDRVGSYVMIGSFDQLGRGEGNDFQYDPGMIAIMKQYCGYEYVNELNAVTGGTTRRSTVKTLEKIPFDIEGKPMAVPRHETNSIYNGSKMGR